MKKILIMASLFWPQKYSGGPTISLLNLVNAVKDKFEIYVISKNHELNQKDKLPGITEGWNKFEFGKAYYTNYGEHSYKKIIKLIEEVRPDTIYQNSFFSADDLVPVLSYKKKNPDVKVIVVPRGEFYPERFKVGQLKKNIYITILKITGMLDKIYFQGTGSEECLQIRKMLSVPEENIYDIQNLSIMKKKNIEIKKNKGNLRLVYIARIHPTKNLLKAIEFLKEVKGDITYDIFGSIEDKEYWEQCKNMIDKLPSNIKVEYKGSVEHELVSEVLLKYHVYYMPTTGENFGHSIVEAMFLGRIVIISDQTPWTEVNKYGGYAIPLSNNIKYIQTLNSLCNMNQELFDKNCEQVNKFINDRLNVEKNIKKYIKLLGE